MGPSLSKETLRISTIQARIQFQRTFVTNLICLFANIILFIYYYAHFLLPHFSILISSMKMAHSLAIRVLRTPSQYPRQLGFRVASGKPRLERNLIHFRITGSRPISQTLLAAAQRMNAQICGGPLQAKMGQSADFYAIPATNVVPLFRSGKQRPFRGSSGTQAKLIILAH